MDTVGTNGRFYGYPSKPQNHLHYESMILGQLLNLIYPAKITFFQLRLRSYDPWDMAKVVVELLLRNLW